MKKKGLKFAILALAMTMTTAAFAGCTKKEAEQGKVGNGAALSGSITTSGSTALQPLVEKSAENFQGKNPDAMISVQGGGSGTGLTQVSQGAVDIGNSDVFAEDKLKGDEAKALVDHKVAAQGFTVVVGKDVKATSLTKAQIQDIFSGKTTNWKDITGEDTPITVIHRPASSGTRSTFINTVLDGKKELENDKIGITQDSNGAVKTAIEKNKGSISYLGLGYLQDPKVKETITTIAIDNVEATKENITNGKYPFWSWGHMYTKGEPTGLTKAFLDYMVSSENKDTMEKLGFISGGEMKVK
ncbi:phosphate ABC transporter substrate-binding protein [Clostridium polyendosporum]|uniref:Phosphate-binding protein n=1 Tax=Clostridium polyendosporum TaxID=69208 RepID=A0A919RX37_9CLOT|nr:phosphate ABC transporter substrate-binding protein [Clostridium polyendosporum]GIM27894.1 phosphate ABC transporter substrate-binding protein [Clostridium polyendosporum]